MSTPRVKKVKRQPVPEHLCPADLVIARFGGIRPLARKLNAMYKKDGSPLMHHSTVIYWRRRDGRIPTERIPDLQKLARLEKVKLTAEEILNGGVA